VGEHARCFGRGETVYDPWHYVPVLARKPGALRNGAPFKDWLLPAGLERVRRKLKGSRRRPADDGDRQIVAILSAVLSDGLAAVEAACREALDQGIHSADVIINILARRRDPGLSATIMTPEALRLHHAPIADCIETLDRGIGHSAGVDLGRRAELGELRELPLVVAVRDASQEGRPSRRGRLQPVCARAAGQAEGLQRIRFDVGEALGERSKAAGSTRRLDPVGIGDHVAGLAAD
jgi:hypothetical protein